MSPEKPRRLGRGLEALIGTSSSSRPDTADATARQNELHRLPLSQIRPNPFQPRREFAEAELADLRASLKASGMLQPIVVRSTGDVFELISGERRFRAATDLGWLEIPALVREADERTMLTLALIENLQRQDLNVIEEARGYQRLHEDFQLTHQQISDAVGKDRSTVTNLLRLLALPDSVQQLLQRNDLSMGHARALLSLPSSQAMADLAKKVVSESLSVRETERWIRKLASPSHTAPSNTGPEAPQRRSQQPRDLSVQSLQNALRRKLQTDVQVQLTRNNKGSIHLSFYSIEDLNRLADLLLGEPHVGD